MDASKIHKSPRALLIKNQAIRTLYEASGCDTYKEFCLRADVAETSFSKWKDGISIPRPSTIRYMADQLDIEIITAYEKDNEYIIEVRNEN